MKSTLYMETTIPSYYTSLPSRDIIVLAHQEITRQWWEKELSNYEIFVSELVLDEASQGDPEAVKRRLNAIKDFKILKITPEIEKLGELYLKQISILKDSLRDAFHLAFSAINGIDYLVTWNCTHIARGEVKKMVHDINEKKGIISPIICTPEELLGGI